MGDAAGRLTITPEMKISELLEHYPDLEPVLKGIAPSYDKIHDPGLRKTIENVTTVRQIADTEGISLGDIMGRLSAAAGCPEVSNEGVGLHQTDERRPDWLENAAVVDTLDAREQIESGGHPLPAVMAALGKLGPGQVFALIAPFTPTPLIGKALTAGCVAWTEQLGPEEFKTYFKRA